MSTSSYKQQAIAQLKAKMHDIENEVQMLENTPVDLRVDELVAAYQESHAAEKLSYGDALRRVLAADGELAKEFGSSMNKEFSAANPSVNFAVRE